ncbi:hypothetical protein P7C70_g8014, partial [Phenoliferia sp. Uapishka_3]
MDQAAFRSLLSTPRPSTSTPSTSRFGAAPPKRTTASETQVTSLLFPWPARSPFSVYSKEEFKRPEFKPRANAKKFKKKEGAADEGAYRDRAAERRDGKDGDFSAAEKLLEDFKARSEAAEDKQAIEEQMKYLGGDAEHSVLVKGLDMALLERMKHEQSRDSDQTLEDVEDELDRALFEKPKKRTRDEMVAELKASRGSSAAGPVVPKDEEASLEKAKAAGRFKPINKPSTKGKEKEKVPEVGEKKRRKKKVKVVEGSMPPPPLPVKAAAPSKVSVPPPPMFDDGDDDGDIFGDVGDYKGLSDSDDDDDDDSATKPKPKPTIPPPPSDSSAATKRKYFDDDEEDAFLASTAPSSVTNLAAEQAARDAKGEQEEDSEEVPMKLTPLSGSSLPSVRDLLDMDKAAEKEELRKAKKLKNKVEAGDKREKVRTAEDKANHDFQVMEKFLENKEKRAKGIAVEDE